MANRKFYQFLYSLIADRVKIQCGALIGASGAVTLSSGAGATVTKLATGLYKVALADKYYGLVGAKGTTGSGNGTPVAITAAVAGTAYRIVVAGNSDFTAIGAANNNLYTVFVATGAGTGTGFVAPVTTSGIVSVELTQLVTNTVVQNQEGLVFACYDAAGALANPASGSTIGFDIDLTNSAIPIKNG